MMLYWCPPTNHAGADALGAARPPKSRWREVAAAQPAVGK